MSVTLTPSAVEHLRKCLADQPPGTRLRISVRPSGCSGYSYALSFIPASETSSTSDTLFTQEGVEFVIDQASLQLMQNTQVDYVKEGLNRFFRFNNPLAKDECGCGESFSV